jgi:hypothetical protein
MKQSAVVNDNRFGRLAPIPLFPWEQIIELAGQEFHHWQALWR